jgi:3-oxoadipate enol-lactonase
MPMIQLDDVRFHYQQRGRGPDVILIHAVTSNLSVWMFSGLMEALAKDFRVTAYDQRGHGASDAPANGYTSADLAEDLRALYRALRLDSALLVGHSFGGVVAMHTASLYPELVRGIILSDPFFPGLADQETNLGDMEVWRQLRQALSVAGVGLGRDVDFTRLFQAIAALTPEQKVRVSETMGESGLRWLSQLPRLASTSCGRDLFEIAGLTAERICQVQQPVVALFDEHTSFHGTRRFLAANLKNICIETVPGARHLAPLQSTDAFVQLVQRHCRALNQAPKDFQVLSPS